MPRYTMGAGTQSGSSTGLTLEQFLAMQAEEKQAKSAKKMQWLGLGIGALGFLGASAQQPIEDKRSAIDAPAIDEAAADVEDYDFSAAVDFPTTRAVLEDFAATVAKVGTKTATAMQRGVDNNGKQGILGGASGNNNNMLLLLGLGLILADD